MIVHVKTKSGLALCGAHGARGAYYTGVFNPDAVAMLLPVPAVCAKCAKLTQEQSK